MQFDPQPLVAGEVDGWFSFVTNEPNLLKVQGVETVNFLLADFNYPLVSQTYMATEETIENEPRGPQGGAQGRHHGLARLDQGPRRSAPSYAVEIYGKDLGLDVPEQTLESEAQNELIVQPDTMANGIMTITDDARSTETIDTLALGGIDDHRRAAVRHVAARRGLRREPRAQGHPRAAWRPRQMETVLSDTDDPRR